MAVGTFLAEGRYRLGRELGAGGMATVYLAEDTRLGVPRAIKVIHPEYAAYPHLMLRFEREARVMAQLEHPNIVPVHDVGHDGDEMFIVMSLLPGGSVADHLEVVGRMTSRQTVRVLVAVLSALEVAHAAGVVHRDIKPHNVLIDSTGAARLSDFGIAAELTQTRLTQTGSMMGTLAYMSPEQRHSSKGVDGRADLYALGAMAVAMLTGREPHELHSASARRSQVAELSPGLDVFVERCTRYEPDERFLGAAAARTFLLDLEPDLPYDPTDTPALGTLHTPPAALEAAVVSGTAVGWLDEEPVETAPDTAETLIPARPSEVTTVAPLPVASPSADSARRWPLWLGGMALVVGGTLVVGVVLMVVVVASRWSPSAGTPADAGSGSVTLAPVERLTEPEPAPVLEKPEPAPVPAEPVETPSAPRPVPVDVEPVAPVMAPAPTPAGPSEAVVYGKLRVNSLPAHRVKVDGVDVGVAPVALRRPVGRYTVIIQSEPPVARQVEVTEDNGGSLCWDFSVDGPC